jgi:hypothetical protein
MKINQPLIISLLLHACLYLGALLSPESSLLPPRQQEVEIVYQNETKQLPRTFVTDPSPENDPEQLIKKLQDQAKHLSRVTRRVEEEIVARRTGRTQNVQRLAPSASALQNSARDRSQELKDFSGDQPSITKPMNQVGRNAQLADSSLAEYIPQVRRGGFTALNSDQFVHYTFYARINEQIRNRWVNLIRDFVDNIPEHELARLSQKTQISQIEIILNPDGQFVKALVHQQSDSRILDERSIAAFRLAAPFMNPPSEMLESDGLIHLHYGFHVHFRPRYYAEGNGQ